MRFLILFFCVPETTCSLSTYLPTYNAYLPRSSLHTWDSTAQYNPYICTCCTFRHTFCVLQSSVLLLLMLLATLPMVPMTTTMMMMSLMHLGWSCCCNLFKDQPSYKCEDGWEKHKGKCYYFSIAKTSWNESRDECGAKKGDLVKINSKEEQEFLESKLKGIKNSDDKFWIELIYLAKNNTWVWRDGSPLNTRFNYCENISSGEISPSTCVFLLLSKASVKHKSLLKYFYYSETAGLTLNSGSLSLKR
uniref:C-type lectin domain-containing protein n=1 Tax=Haplochromis burtoni TaxID=8153 RepID=A0A3Q2X5L9_HAPBU